MQCFGKNPCAQADTALPLLCAFLSAVKGEDYPRALQLSEEILQACAGEACSVQIVSAILSHFDERAQRAKRIANYEQLRVRCFPGLVLSTFSLRPGSWQTSARTSGM